MRTRWAGLLGLLVPAGTVFAQSIGGNTGSNGIRLSNPLGVNSLQDALAKILAPDKVLAIAAPIVTIMVLYGAFLMLFSAGNEERVSQGRKTILYAAIGFVIVLLSSSVVPIIQSIFK